MEKIEFLCGNEKRFSEFISTLGDEDKIAIISHKSDLDGVASAKIANAVIEADKIIFVGYDDINLSFIEQLKSYEINKIIFTDLYVKEPDFIKEIEKFATVLIIDHHQIVKDYNSEKTFFINAQGYCAAYISYYLFSKVQDITQLDWLAACASISDWEYSKNVEFMSETFEKHDAKFYGQRIEDMKKTKFWDLQIVLTLAIIYYRENAREVFDRLGREFGDIGSLRVHAKEVQEEIDKFVENFEKRREVLNGRLYLEYKPEKFSITSLASNILSQKYFNDTLILVKIDDEDGMCKVSLRCQTKKEDMNKLINRLIEGWENSRGGGHIAAAGGSFPLKYLGELRKRLEKLPKI